MTDPFDTFIGSALTIGLTDAEKSHCRHMVLQKTSNSSVRNDQPARLPVGMDTPSFEQFTAAAASVNLTSAERSGIRSVLLTHAAQHEPAGETSSGFLGWFWMFKGIPAMAMVLFLLVGAGAGVSYAAEGALPGDALYAIKLHINEAFLARLAANTAEAQARIEAQWAQRRLQEAELLAGKQQLTPERRLQLASAFNQHASRVKNEITALAASDNTTAATDIDNSFQASLEAHETVMTGLSHGQPASSDHAEMALLIDNVREAKRDSALSRTTMEIALSGIPTEQRESSLKQSISFTAKRLAEVRGAVERKNTIEAEQKLDLADKIFAEAKTSIDKGAYADGLGLLRQGLRNAEEAKLISDLHGRVKAKVQPAAPKVKQGQNSSVANSMTTDETASSASSDLSVTGHTTQDTFAPLVDQSASAEVSAHAGVSAMLARPILHPQYQAVSKSIDALQGIIVRSHGILPAAVIAKASERVLVAQNTQVAAQAAFDAGDDDLARELFGKALEETKKGTELLAQAARQAIQDANDLIK